jgi:hypothetical protein
MQWGFELLDAAECGGLSLRCHRATVYRDIKIRRTSAKGYSCRFAVYTHNDSFKLCPVLSWIILSHLFLSQVIVNYLESLKLLMLEVCQFNIRYTGLFHLHSR